MDDRMILQMADETLDFAVGIRRALHRIPEPGDAEYDTQRLICATLDSLGIEYATEKTWTVGLVRGAYPGKTVAIRADIDALPVTEPEGCPFRSEREGMMHACGHDAHTAILLGAAKILNGLRGELHGCVKLLFQPAEETNGGAERMVQAGVMENPHVDYVFGLHVMPRLPLGTVETRAGTLNASTDGVTITVRGVSGHGAYPESGADAIVCAAQMITALQTLVSRNLSPLSSAVLSFGKIEGGRASNIICDRVSFTGTLRTASPEIRAMMKRRIAEVAAGVASAMGCSAEVDVRPGYNALVNDKNEAARIRRVAARLFGEDRSVEKPEPSMGAEDFSFFNDAAPGAFFHIGCVREDELPAPALHSDQFHLDERCLAVGMAMHTALALDILKGE